MGLDSIELVMVWEESFGLSISNADAATLVTPRMAIDFLALRLGATGSQSGCLTVRAFNRLRSAISSNSVAVRGAIRPKTLLRDLAPARPEQRTSWEAVRLASGIPALPSLRWDVGFSLAPMTVGELSHWVVVHAAHFLKPPDEPWTRFEIRAVIRAGVTDTLGIKEFSDDDQFVRDLGID